MAFIAKQRYKLDIAPKGGWVIVYASQHDDGAREIEFVITNQGNAFSIPASINVSVQGIKANKSYFSHSCSYSGNVVTMALADDMTDVVGKAICVLKFTNSSQQKLATAKFILNVDSDSSSEGVIIDTEAEEIFSQMLNEIRAQAASISADIAELQSMVGSPLVASTVSGMTDHNKIYVYVGSESGYTNGNWYYWNGSAWTSGGVYNSTAFETDKTLSIENMPADAEVTGNKITGLKGDLNDIQLQPTLNLINERNLLKSGKWNENNGIYSGVLEKVADSVGTAIGGFDVYAPFESDVIYVLTGKVRNTTGIVTTGNGLRINFNYKDGTQDRFYIVNSATETRSFSVQSATSKTLAFVSFGYSNSTGDIWEISELMLQKKSDSESEYVPFKLNAVDTIARNQITNISDGVDNCEIERYSLNVGFYINNSTNVVSFEPLVNDTYSYGIISCKPGDRFLIGCWTYGTLARRWAFVTKEGALLSMAESQSQATRYINTGEIIVAPNESAYLVVNHKTVQQQGYSPFVYKIAKLSGFNYILKKTGVIPYYDSVEWHSNVIAVYKYMCAIVDNGLLKISTNCGGTWTEGIDISEIGNIVHAHFYNDGTLGFFTNTKAYYTETYDAYSEAICYEADGTTYTPMDAYNFDVAADTAVRKVINGVDMYVFGNYILSSSGRRLIWYSIDSGKTYKIAYEFGVGGNYNIRHIHIIYYYEPQDVFIVCAGDSAEQSYVFEMTYDIENESFEISVLGGPSRDYKWSYIDVWDGYIYYAHDVAPSAVKRVKYLDIGDVLKHEIVLDNIPNDCTICVFGPSGDMIVLQSSYRSLGGGTSESTLSEYVCCRKIYYSADRKSFYEIMMPPIIMSSYTLPFWFLPVSNGNLVSRMWDDAGNHLIKTPSIFITEIVRSAGFPQAFLPI